MHVSILWTPTKRGAVAYKDGRTAIVKQRDDGLWDWLVCYEGDPDYREGECATKRAAQAHAGSYLR